MDVLDENIFNLKFNKKYIINICKEFKLDSYLMMEKLNIQES